MKPPTKLEEIKSAFGDPSNTDGSLNTQWEISNIKLVSPPAGWQLYYQDEKKGNIAVKGIRMHKLLQDDFVAILDEVWNYAKNQIGDQATEIEIQQWLHEKRVDQHGGGFNYRHKSGNDGELSLHAFGIAIDWDPIHNPRQKPLIKTLPDWWYQVWNDHGWTDGRHFKTPDPMHVQFATGY
jgi:hypothetical protein